MAWATSCDNSTCSEFEIEKVVRVKEENKILYIPAAIQCAVCLFSLRLRKIPDLPTKDQEIHIHVNEVRGDDFGNGYRAGFEEGLRRRR